MVAGRVAPAKLADREQQHAGDRGEREQAGDEEGEAQARGHGAGG
jgi:hypothetical protein